MSLQGMTSHDPSGSNDSVASGELRDFATSGILVVPPSSGVVSEADWAELSRSTDPTVCAYETTMNPEKTAPWIHVARFMLDLSRPTLTQHPCAPAVARILLGDGLMRLYELLLGCRPVVRRFQAHVLPRNSSVRRHNDLLDNPDYKLSVFFVTKAAGLGGEFVCYHGDVASVYECPPGTIFAIRSKVEHSVNPVLEGERRSCVLFVSESDAENQAKPRAHLLTSKYK